MSLAPLLQDHSQSAAEGIMRGAIDLAASTNTGPSKVVLSLGPYGAVLSPSQEYGGIYRPPYGPPLPSSSSRPNNAFASSEDGEAARAGAEDALAKWHLARLRIYASEEGTWRKVSWLGFETVPLLTEIRAIRIAMGRLNAELKVKWGAKRGEGEGGREWWDKKFWISSAYPEGKHPQHFSSTDEEGQVGVEDVLEDLLGDSESSPRPDGIGINCTHPAHISSLTYDFSTAMTRRLVKAGSEGDVGPTFVLYPDGGAVYDTVSRTWTERTTNPEEWARGLVAVARDLESAEVVVDGASRGKVWGGVIVGGCCKAGFEEIGYLRRVLDK